MAKKKELEKWERNQLMDVTDRFEQVEYERMPVKDVVEKVQEDLAFLLELVEKLRGEK